MRSTTELNLLATLYGTIGDDIELVNSNQTVEHLKRYRYVNVLLVYLVVVVATGA